MTPFLITGLPRSRTAWLSMAATIPGVSHCEHEPSFRLHCVDDLRQYYKERMEPYVGISDSHLAQVLPEILEAMPMRTLIILRPAHEVVESLRRNGLSPRALPAMMQGLHAAIGAPEVRTIKYEDLSDSAKLAKALQWLMPDAVIDVARIEAMQGVHIEANLEENRKAWVAHGA